MMNGLMRIGLIEELARKTPCGYGDGVCLQYQTDRWIGAVLDTRHEDIREISPI